MTNSWDASVKLAYAVEEFSFYTAQTVQPGQAFDVIANVEIGADLNKVADHHTAKATLINVTTGQVVNEASYSTDIEPFDGPRKEEIRLQFPADWAGSDLDVLKAYVVYKVRAGVHTDYSTKHTDNVIVAALIPDEGEGGEG